MTDSKGNWDIGLGQQLVVCASVAFKNNGMQTIERVANPEKNIMGVENCVKKHQVQIEVLRIKFENYSKSNSTHLLSLPTRYSCF